MPEMWLSACVGVGSRKNVAGAKAHDVPKLVSSSRRQLNQICYSPSVIPKGFMRVVTAAVFSVLIL